MRSIKPILIVLGVSAMLLGPVGLQIPSVGADAAFAGNGNGNGGSNGNSGGNGGGNGKSGGKSNSGNGGGNGKAAASTDTASAGETSKGKNAHGLLASELKGLNAAHANPNALANASPNSQVGRLAAYRDAALAAVGAQAAIDDANDALAAFDAADQGRTIAEIETDIAALDPAAEGYDPALLEALNAELTAAQTRDEDRAALVDAIADAETAAAGAGETEAEALLAAANGRTLSPEAIAYIRKLLDI